jgi:hypothetical protein
MALLASMIALFVLAGVFGIAVALAWAGIAWPDEWLQQADPRPETFVIRGDQVECTSTRPPS